MNASEKHVTVFRGTSYRADKTGVVVTNDFE